MNDIPARIIDGHFHSALPSETSAGLTVSHFEAVFEELPQLESVVTSSLVAATGVQAAGSDDTQSVIDAMGTDRVKGSVWIVPSDPRWRDDAEMRLDAGFVAFKIHGPLGEYKLGIETLGPVMELASERQIPVTFHFSDPEGLDELAGAFSDVTMVLFHSGSLAGMKLAKRHGNIILETSVADNFLIEVLVRMIGADRVMFGCDAPLCWCAKGDMEAIGVGSYYDNLLDICGLDLTQAELDTICCDVPRKVYGI